MAQSRIDVFAQMVKDQPGDPMIWYGLGSEYIKLERWSEAATALTHVIDLNPDYTAAYQLLGTALMHQGQREEACRIWSDGVATATRTGAWKARQHIEGLLADARTSNAPSTTSSAPGLCTER